MATTTPMRQAGASREGLDVLTWIGVDPRGEELEIVGLERETGDLEIFHVMPRKYRT